MYERVYMCLYAMLSRTYKCLCAFIYCHVYAAYAKFSTHAATIKPGYFMGTVCAKKNNNNNKSRNFCSFSHITHICISCIWKIR